MNAQRDNQLSNITLVTGQDSTQKLENGQRNMAVELTVSGTTDLSADGTGIRNRGSVLAAVTSVFLSVDGENRYFSDARLMRAYAEFAAGRPLPRKRAAAFTAAAAAENIYETVPLFLANPSVAVPEETALLERSTNVDMLVGVNTNADVTKIIKGGTATLTNLAVKVRQVSDPFRGGKYLPLLRPRMRQLTLQITASGEVDLDLALTRYLGGLVIQQDTDSEGEVTDIINSFRLTAEGGAALIPKNVTFADWARHNSPTGLDGEPVGGYSYAFFNPLSSGRLSKVVHPAVYPKLKLTFDAQPSVTGTGSKVRVLVLEYEQDKELTTPGALPFNL